MVKGNVKKVVAKICSLKTEGGETQNDAGEDSKEDDKN